MTTAKGLTNGAVPMGAVFAHRKIYDACMQGPENAIELFHGYTYSAHPIACAAALATLDMYAKEGLLTRAATLAPEWESAVHSLRGLPHVIDVRNYGLIGAVELEPRAGKPGARAFEVFLEVLRARRHGASDRRHHRHVAAVDHRVQADRADDRDPGRGDSRNGLKRWI